MNQFKMQKQKKSQITFVPLIAVVILILAVLLFFFFLLNQRSEVGPSQQVRAELQPVNTYVTQCLETTATESLELLGGHGGWIYNNLREPLTEYSGVYPALQAIDDPGNLGYYRLSKLKEEDAGIGNGWDAHLKTYVLENLDTCLDLTLFEDRNFIIDKGDKELEVIIGEDDVSFILGLPIEINNRKFDSKESKYTANFRISLTNIHTISTSTINLDTEDPVTTRNDFDLKNADFITLLTDDGFKIDSSTIVEGGDDIIRMADTNSLLNNKPFVLQFKRMNRKPEITKHPTCIVADDLPGDFHEISPLDPLRGLEIKDYDEEDTPYPIIKEISGIISGDLPFPGVVSDDEFPVTVTFDITDGSAIPLANQDIIVDLNPC